LLSQLKIVAIALALASLAAPASAQIHQLNSDEMTLFQKISSNSAQQRKKLNLDPILCIVARERGADMARRHYFSHTTPGGKGANFFVRSMGYALPSYYDLSRSGNNIESIGMSTGTSQEMVSLWLNSKPHRAHVMGEVDFYQQQTSIGVGVFRSAEAPYYKYFVFLSAPPNLSPKPRLVILKNPKGVTLASTRPLAAAWAALTGISTP
jgi:uncharacterized protein YkwD